MDLLSLFDFLNKGGWVSYVLAFLSLILWYALGYRYFFLKTDCLKISPKEMVYSNKELKSDFVSRAVREIRSIFASKYKDPEVAIRSSLTALSQELEAHKQTIKSIVIVAPLLGLLGTVIGMIETFSSLQDSALFSQSGGIAGGISQALITTQMGLVVAIPGLLVGKKLDRKQEEISSYIEQVTSLYSTEEGLS